MDNDLTKAELTEQLQAAEEQIASLEFALRLYQQGQVRDARLDERQGLEEELLQNEIRYRSLIQALDISLCRWKPDTTLTFANERYCQIFGIQGDPNGRKWLSFLPEDSRNETAVFYEDLVAHPKTVAYEHAVADKDGRQRFYHWIDTPIFGDEGALVEFQSIGIDVTERKQVEEQAREGEKKYRDLINGINDTVWVIDDDATILDVNDVAIRVIGYTREELLSMKVFDIDANLRHGQIQSLITRMSKNKVQVFETAHRTKAGRVFPVEVSSSLASYRGRTVILSIARDITERKQTEEALRQSEARMRALVENAPGAILLVGANGQLKFVSDSIKAMGYQPEEFLKIDPVAMTHPEDRDALLALLAELMQQPGAVRTTQYRFRGVDGEWRWVESTISSLLNVPGVEALVINFQDISERQKVEQALKASMENYRSLADNSESAIAVLDRSGKILYANPWGIGIWNDPQIVGKTIFDVYPPEYAGRYDVAIKRVIDSGVSIVDEVKSLINNRIMWFRLNMSPLKNPDGTVSSLLLNAWDMTERKQAEEQVRTSEQKLRSLLESQSHFLLRTDLDGKITYWNSTYEAEFGWLHPEGMQGTESALTAICDYHHDRARETVEKCIGTPGKVFQVELDKPAKGGWVRTALWDFTCLTDGSNQPTEIQCMGIEITERKKAEAKLAETERRYRALIENAPDGIVLVGMDGKIKYASPSVERLFGYTQEEALQRAPNEMTHPDDRAMVLEKIMALIGDPAYTPTIQYRFLHKNGEWRWIESTLSNLLTQPGVEAIIINFRDIHERKLAEEALKESQKLLREAQRIGRIGHIEWNGRGQTPICSDELYDILELPRGTVITQSTIGNMMIPGDAQRIQKIDHKAFREHTDMDYVYRIHLKDGSERWLHQMGKVSYGENGAPIRMMAIVQDITERKQTELALRESEERYQQFIEQSFEAISRTEFDSPIDTSLPVETQIDLIYQRAYLAECNQAMAEMYGFSSPDEMVGKRFIDTHGSKNDPVNRASFRHLIESGYRSINDETFEYDKSGNPIWLLNNTIGSVVDGQLLRLWGTATNITDRKRAEMALLESGKRIEMALEGANAGMWDWNIKTGEVTFNARWAEMLGYTLEELSPTSIQTWANLCHPEDLQKSDDLLEKHFAGKSKYYECEVRMKHKDGSWLWVIDRGKVMEWDAEKKPVRMFGTHLDITERKQAEEQIHRQMEDMTLVNMLNEAANRGESLEKIIEILSTESSRIFHCQAAAIYLLSPDGQHFILQHNTLPQSVRSRVEKFLKYPIPKIELALRPGSFLSQALNSDRGHIASDPGLLQQWILEFAETTFLPDALRPAVKALVPQIYKLLGIKSVIAIPLNSGDKRLGALELSSSNLFTEHDLDRLQNVRASLTEIIKRKQVEQELTQSEEKYRQLAEQLEVRVLERTAEVQDLYNNAPTGYHSLDADGRYAMINQTELNWLGYTRDEVMGHSFTEFITEASRDLFRSTYPSFKERGFVNDLEHELVRKDGTIIPVLLSATAIKDQEGNFIMSRSTVFDNSQRKKAEIALRQSEEQNRLLFEEAPESVVLFDEHGHMVRVNRAFESLIGHPREELLGVVIDQTDFLPHEELQRLIESIEENTRAEAKFTSAAFKIKRADSLLRDVRINVFPLRIQGKVHYLTTMHDVTAEKQAEETLRLANNELERALRLKDEFLANMSHELRTPLNAILGISESLAEQVAGPLNEKQVKYTQTIQESGQHLLALINDVLDLAKINAGKVELDMGRVDAAALAQSCLRLVRELAHKKDLDISLELDPTVSLFWADERRLKQMIVNLLSNAVKFTPAGGRIGLEIRGDLQGRILRFCVWDTGIGIHPEEVQYLFQPFVQLDAGLARGTQGTGLGLVLVSQMARLHGGSVGVESQPGLGSRFTISIPWVNAQTGSLRLQTGRSAVAAAQPQARAARPVVLLIEDTEAITMLIHDYLESHGFQVFVARNGLDGIAQARQVHPQIILMDVMMPEMDGLETTRRLRVLQEFKGTPIIALTALAMPGDRERCLAAGMNDYLAKPVNLRELVSLLEQYLALGKEGGA